MISSIINGWVRALRLPPDERAPSPPPQRLQRCKSFCISLFSSAHRVCLQAALIASLQQRSSRLHQPGPQPRRLPVTSHPSWPCPTARACGLPAADRAGQPLAGRRTGWGDAGGLRSPGVKETAPMRRRGRGRLRGPDRRGARGARARSPCPGIALLSGSMGAMRRAPPERGLPANRRHWVIPITLNQC